ncbi:hypothetical protein GCM10023321_65660 [Pseudonocardia eucalypti]|uniref:Pyridoxamine 5'-phosphate oxidase N-terminal domain-containing protein n=1 Tax=Pseudonocardia eucalypti TaxID=648755 RepID=A0ABP9QZ08_9PSEU
MGVLPDTAPPDAVTTEPRPTLPGSAGEHLLQCAYGSQDRAARFYADQVRDRLLPRMVEFIGRMEMVFVATSDDSGECDASLRAGPPGFIQVLDERHLAYPEYRGNGVHASLGNITENPHVGLLMMDFERDLIGLHVNGPARVETDERLRARHPELPLDGAPGRRAERWVVVEVHEAYIHCRKHIPRMTRVHEKREWGTDDPARKGGDYFGAKEAPVDEAPAKAPAPSPADDPTGPIQVPRQRGRSGFPSTTHLPAGAATARPLRPLSVGPRDRRRPRWLTS